MSTHRQPQGFRPPPEPPRRRTVQMSAAGTLVQSFDDSEPLPHDAHFSERDVGRGSARRTRVHSETAGPPQQGNP
jgi:hypothetical protein